jgi:hypothetical protein
LLLESYTAILDIMGDLLECSIDELEDIIRISVASNPWSDIDHPHPDPRGVMFADVYGYGCRNAQNRADQELESIQFPPDLLTSREALASETMEPQQSQKFLGMLLRMRKAGFRLVTGNLFLSVVLAVMGCILLIITDMNDYLAI